MRNLNKRWDGLGALGYRSGDIETLQEWLPDLLEEHDLEFLHAGHVPSQGDFSALAGINPSRLRTLPMQPMNRYHLHVPDGYRDRAAQRHPFQPR